VHLDQITRMSGLKESKYAIKSTEGQIAELSKKLLANARQDVRRLRNYEYLSPDWKKLAPVVYRLGNIAQAESEIPKESKSETLWDGAENVSRFILEDGKLLTCFNLLTKTTRERLKVGKLVSEKADDDLSHKFEIGVGKLLKYCWLHEEAVQIVPIQSLVKYIGEVLRHTLLLPGEALVEIESDMQEVLVTMYLERVCLNLETINYTEAWRYIRKENIIPFASKIILKMFQVIEDTTSESYFNKSIYKAMKRNSDPADRGSPLACALTNLTTVLLYLSEEDELEIEEDFSGLASTMECLLGYFKKFSRNWKAGSFGIEVESKVKHRLVRLMELCEQVIDEAD